MTTTIALVIARTTSVGRRDLGSSCADANSWSPSGRLARALADRLDRRLRTRLARIPVFHPVGPPRYLSAHESTPHDDRSCRRAASHSRLRAACISLPWAVIAQITRTSSVMTISAHSGYAGMKKKLAIRLRLADDHTDRASQDVAAEQPDAGEQHREPDDQMDPAPLGDVEVQRGAIRPHDPFVVDDGDESVERVEAAADDHHDAGEGDPAGPARPCRPIAVSSRVAPLRILGHRPCLSVMWSRPLLGPNERTPARTHPHRAAPTRADVITHFE